MDSTGDFRKIPFSPPDITDEEIKEVTDALKSGWITTGPKTKELERIVAKRCNTDKAACFSSSTAAMEMTLRILGIGQGDEVIVPAYTYTATASVVCHVGATPVMADVERGTFKIDKKQLKNLINERTKAIIPVDFAGVIEDYDEITDIVQSEKHLFKAKGKYQEAYGRPVIIADSAHGFGASQKGKMSGEIADFTSFSFHAVKNFTTAEGGAITWKEHDEIDGEELYNKFMLYSLHGQNKDALAKSRLGSWEYDIVAPLYKCNMTDIQAAIGTAQSKRYDSMLARRREIISMYENGLKGDIEITEHMGKDFTSSGHLMIVRIPGLYEAERNEFIVRMAERGVACNVHYKPLPMLSAYKNMGFDIKDYPNAYDMYRCEISLPLHTLLSDDDVRYVTDKFNEVYGEMPCH
ncbi:MAG: DegT/DnrJ/EryC1/StrS aminotransferase family protein [Lachnospiraceae bacterium]|nr:DegT/DnrJ/EryC1/StrS aminotransferase family protein [Lachnospiraceae bacterium]